MIKLRQRKINRVFTCAIKTKSKSMMNIRSPHNSDVSFILINNYVTVSKYGNTKS